VSRQPNFPRDDRPALVIVLPIESPTPEVYSRVSGPSERRRLIDWLGSHPELKALVDAALNAPLPEWTEKDEQEEDDGEDEPGWGHGALMFRSYEHWPMLALRDLQPTDGEWLGDHGIQVEGSRVVAWDVERFPYVEDAEVWDPCFRPGPAFAPSLREIEERDE
jgi:hypothetical protein